MPLASGQARRARRVQFEERERVCGWVTVVPLRASADIDLILDHRRRARSLKWRCLKEFLV